MRCQRVAQVIHVSDDVDDAGREDLGGKFAESQCRQRRGRGGLDHHGVTGEQRRGQLDHQQDDREVPGRDGGHDAQRHVVLHDARAVAFLQHLGRQVHGGKSLNHVNGTADFVLGRGQGLALFLRQHPRDVLQVGPEGVGELQQQAAPLGNGGGGPGRKGGLGGGDGLIELVQVGTGAGRQQILRGRVDHVESGCAGNQPAVDQQVELGSRVGLQLGIHGPSPGEYQRKYTANSGGKFTWSGRRRRSKRGCLAQPVDIPTSTGGSVVGSAR